MQNNFPQSTSSDCETDMIIVDLENSLFFKKTMN